MGTQIVSYYSWEYPIYNYVFRKGITIVYCEKLEYLNQAHSIEYIKM